MAKAIKLQKWPEKKAKRVYNKAVSGFIVVTVIFILFLFYNNFFSINILLSHILKLFCFIEIFMLYF